MSDDTLFEDVYELGDLIGNGPFSVVKKCFQGRCIQLARRVQMLFGDMQHARDYVRF